MYDSKEDTIKHKLQVEIFVKKIIKELNNRAKNHDNSKLEEPEKSIFDEYSSKLKNSIYGSWGYNKFLKEMKIALDHHYEHNPHHPEYREDGIKGMDLVDIVEMICDWKAASIRHDTGDILKSMDVNQKRFKYSDDLKCIFINTINRYFTQKDGE